MKTQITLEASKKGYLLAKLPRDCPPELKTAFAQVQYCVPHLKSPAALILCTEEAYQNWLIQLGKLPSAFQRIIGLTASMIIHKGHRGILIPIPLIRFAKMQTGKVLLILHADGTLLLKPTQTTTN